MKNFVLVLCFATLFAFHADACKNDTNVYESCQCVIQKYFKVFRETKNIPEKHSEFFKEKGYFDEKEWNKSDMETLIKDYFEEFKNWDSPKMFELFEEATKTDWNEIIGKKMEIEYNGNKECFYCCGGKAMDLFNQIRNDIGLFKDK